jgi:hypothetical protein
LSLVLFFGVLTACLFALIRYRHAPTIYWLTTGLLIAAAIWNHYAANSCKGGCDIRVDLLFVLPVLLVAVVLSARAFLKRKTG